MEREIFGRALMALHPVPDSDADLHIGHRRSPWQRDRNHLRCGTRPKRRRIWRAGDCQESRETGTPTRSLLQLQGLPVDTMWK